MNKNQLKLIHLNLGTVWLDAEIQKHFFQAAQYVKTIQERHNILLGSPEITSFNQKWISKNKLKRLISEMKENDYKSKLIDFFKNLMEIYYINYLLIISIYFLLKIKSLSKLENTLFYFICLYFIIFVGARFEVGGDWFVYLKFQ